MTGLIYNSDPKLPLDSAGLSMSKKLFHCSVFDPTNSSWSKMRNLPQWLMQSIQMLCQAFRDILGITTSWRASTAKHKCYKKLVYSIQNTVNMSFKTWVTTEPKRENPHHLFCWNQLRVMPLHLNHGRPLLILSSQKTSISVEWPKFPQ